MSFQSNVSICTWRLLINNLPAWNYFLSRCPTHFNGTTLEQLNQNWFSKLQISKSKQERRSFIGTTSKSSLELHSFDSREHAESYYWVSHLHYARWVSNSDWYKYFIREAGRFLKIICLIKLTLIIMLSSVTVGSLLILQFLCKYWTRKYTIISKMKQGTRAGVNRESPDCQSEDSHSDHCCRGCKGEPLIMVDVANFECIIWFTPQVCSSSNHFE